MNPVLRIGLTWFWQQIQSNLFSFLDETELALTPGLQEAVTVLKKIEIERFPGARINLM
jgi:hypothetical protein